MRYHRSSPWLLCAILVLCTLLTTSSLRSRSPGLIHALPFVYVALGAFQVALYLLVYWQLEPDALVERRLWRKRVVPYTEINRVGPVTGKLENHSAVKNWVEIRYSGMEKIFASPSRYPDFVSDLRAHTPNAFWSI